MIEDGEESIGRVSTRIAEIILDATEEEMIANWREIITLTVRTLVVFEILGARALRVGEWDKALACSAMSSCSRENIIMVGALAVGAGMTTVEEAAALAKDVQNTCLSEFRRFGKVLGFPEIDFS